MAQLKHTRVASEGAFPSIVKSTLWGTQDLALLSPSSAAGYTKTDRQATKIADYIHVYSRPTPSRPSLTGKSTAHTLKAEDGKASALSSAKPSHELLPSPKPPIGRSREKEQLKREAEDLTYLVTKAASDKLELMRDLATYEHCFGKAVGLSERLLELRSHAAQLPTIFDNLNSSLLCERQAYAEVRTGLDLIGGKRTQTVRTVTPSELPIRSALELRRVSEAFRSRLLYSGSAVISNLPCLVAVSGDGLFRNLKITAQTLSGALFRMSVQQDLLTRQNLTTGPQIRKAVKSLILPRLHFTAERNAMKLHFDPDCGLTFASLIVEVRGWGEGLVTVWLTEAATDIVVELSIAKDRLQIPMSEFTAGNSLFPCDLQATARILTHKLLWVQEEVQWVEAGSRDKAFLQREHHSKFLSDDYLTEVFQILSFQLVAVERTQVEGLAVKVEVLAHKKTVRLRLSTEEKSLELDSGSPDLLFLISLQSMDLLTGRAALLKSLEFRTVVKKLLGVKA